MGNKGAKGIPCITFNNVINGCHSVRSDHAQGLELGLKKLSEMGHKRIAFVLNNSEGWGNSERVKGYQQGIRKHRLVSETGLLQRYEKNITEALAKCLLLKPTAIIVSGEDAAIEANYAVKVLGRRIPEDISLVTFEHAAVSRHMFPPNSTISQDLQCMAEAAADLAAAFLEGKGPKSPKDFIFKNSFIERESTRHLKGTRQ